MKVKRRQSGLTLTEMAVVVATIALLVGIGLPAVRALLKSFESESGAKTMISSALASARAIAAKEQSYAGIRFQKAYDPSAPDPMNASQYMVFIIHDTQIKPSVRGNLGCRAVEGLNPIKLPDSVGVMDLKLGSQTDEKVNTDGEINDPYKLVDVTTFSILFSPSGKLMLHTHKAQNGNNIGNIINDSVFNTKSSIQNKIGMFLEDQDQASIQPVDELSRSHFFIYDRAQFKQAYNRGRAWSDYLRKLEPIYINAYTGTMISTD